MMPIGRTEKVNEVSSGLFLVLLWFLCALLTGCASTPSGAYYDPYIGSVEPAYWVFKDGKVYLKIEGSADRYIGTYSKSEDKWFLHGGDDKQDDIVLIPKYLGIRMIPVSTNVYGMNLYLPRKHLTWFSEGKSYNE